MPLRSLSWTGKKRVHNNGIRLLNIKRFFLCFAIVSARVVVLCLRAPMAACFSQFSIMFLIVVGDQNLRYPGIIPQQAEESGIPSPQSVTKKPNFNKAWCSMCILTQDLDAELDRKFHFPLGCQDFWIARGMNRGAPRRKCAGPLIVERMASKARGVQNFRIAKK